MMQSFPAARLLAAVLLVAAALMGKPASAQQIQIPSLQVCNSTAMKANAFVIIDTRVDIASTGFFSLRGDVSCRPTTTLGPYYPTGTLGLFGISMSDSTVVGDVVFTTFDQLTSGGKHTPTLWLSGQCKAEKVVGCRYWVMAVDNVRGQPVGKTFDIVSFLVMDRAGKRVAYGTGNVVDGDITISAAN